MLAMTQEISEGKGWEIYESIHPQTRQRLTTRAQNGDRQHRTRELEHYNRTTVDQSQYDFEVVNRFELRAMGNCAGSNRTNREIVERWLARFERLSDEHFEAVEREASEGLMDEWRMRIARGTENSAIAFNSFLAQRISMIRNEMDRTYLAIQMAHAMRLEEVLGLKWSDVDLKNGLFHIRRAVTHPNRNQPEVKETKTDASRRSLAIVPSVAAILKPGDVDHFVIGGEKPLSYTQVRSMCRRIQKDTGFEESVTPIRFRTTTLTDMYDQLKDIKQVQSAAGHTTAAMTLKYYVKGRGDSRISANAIAEAYGIQ